MRQEGKVGRQAGVKRHDLLFFFLAVSALLPHAEMAIASVYRDSGKVCLAYFAPSKNLNSRRETAPVCSPPAVVDRSLRTAFFSNSSFLKFSLSFVDRSVSFFFFPLLQRSARLVDAFVRHTSLSLSLPSPWYLLTLSRTSLRLFPHPTTSRRCHLGEAYFGVKT